MNISSLYQPMKILLVEDNIPTQFAQKKLLEELLGDVQIDVANNGQEAISYYSTEYSVILMDIGLPDISGIEVTKLMQERFPDSPVPIIAITAYDKDIIQEDCATANFAAILHKPILQQELLNIVTKVTKSALEAKAKQSSQIKQREQLTCDPKQTPPTSPLNLDEKP